MAKKKLSFEEALKALEGIAEQIEHGQIGLEESIARYEEGMGLIRQCRDILARAELQIQQLQEKADGTLEAGRSHAATELRSDEGEEERQ
ncbi:MAG: exodeoxyribonuclease VII small subunit [Phycisphaerae bacterium]|nr:exodeoxyribonuclease VII small subunit [Phycisphaerae bacterium]